LRLDRLHRPIAMAVFVDIHGLAPFELRLRKEETATVKAFLRALPFNSSCERWGDEVYFSVPFHSRLEEDARAEMNNGDVAFWPNGDALALFFGPTPSSKDQKPKAYSPCNIIGTIEGDLSKLRDVRAGTEVDVYSR